MVAVGGQATIWRVPEKSFRAAARQHPDLSLLLFQAAFGGQGALTQALQVWTCRFTNKNGTHMRSSPTAWHRILFIATLACMQHASTGIAG